MKSSFDKVLVILPFEEELLRKEGINAVYIGHPLTDGLAAKMSGREEFCLKAGIDPARPLVGLVPGSRPREIRTLMPVFMKAVEMFSLKFPEYQYALGRAPSIARHTIVEYIKGAPVTVVEHMTPDLMRYSDMLWICSGTATLEAAIIGVPMIILYKISRLDAFISRRLTKLRMVGMPNIISGKYVVPELLMDDCNAQCLAEWAGKMHGELDEYRDRLAHISSMFTGYTPIKNAAQEIIKTLQEKMAKDPS
jgi:lipid-A-disaccharide synthase